MLLPVGTASATFVQTLRILMSTTALVGPNHLSAYIIPSGDAHRSEYIAECQKRREFISGFTGSAGTVIVGLEKALLWTDGRYFLQAKHQLDNATWTLMKDGLHGTPTQANWLIQNLPSGTYVGVDSTLYSKWEWDEMAHNLYIGNITLIAVKDNLVDIIWSNVNDRPICSTNKLISLDVKFSGKRTSEKIRDVRTQMKSNAADALVISELDEVAWLLNLRGNRIIPESSIFYAYVIVTATTVEFFVNNDQITQDIHNTLKIEEANMSFHDYNEIFNFLNTTVRSTTSAKIWLSPMASIALVNLVPQFRQIIKMTPISVMKAIKNDVEVEGFRKALIRDGAALSVFFAWVEAALNQGEIITEISAAEKLYLIRRERENFMDHSFFPVSASGPNSAIIHYYPTKETDRRLHVDEIYLLDSGGLYFDGTTDITRTVHFGVPTDHQSDCYTRVLKGQIALVKAIFPNHLLGHRLDSFARHALWQVGLDYSHGTGHGIGSSLNVHEGPHSIGAKSSAEGSGLQHNMITSNEPGYYEENEFGIRLENDIRIVKVELPHNFQDNGFLGFEDLTFVPYQLNMIKTELLSSEEINYLNNYQVKCRVLLGQYIRENKLGDAAFNWLMKETEPIGSTNNLK